MRWRRVASVWGIEVWVGDSDSESADIRVLIALGSSYGGGLAEMNLGHA